jgi:sulfopyruvate decarboxylase subunit beta
VVECQAQAAAETVQAALDSGQMTIIVCKCESGNIKVPVIDTDPVVIRDRFMKEVKSRNSG